jgi:hypothetical protein
MPARPHPHLHCGVQVKVTRPLRRDQPAISDAPRVSRALLAEELALHGRLDSIGTDQDVNLSAGAVSEARLNPIATVAQTGEPLPEVDAPDRHGSSWGVQQVGAMDHLVREPECLLDEVGERRAQQSAAVVKAPLMPGRGLHAGAGEVVPGGCICLGCLDMRTTQRPSPVGFVALALIR